MNEKELRATKMLEVMMNDVPDITLKMISLSGRTMFHPVNDKFSQEVTKLFYMFMKEVFDD